MKKEELRDTFNPPPVNDLPDYIHGRLIFQDTTSDDNCRWVVYDGRTFFRCPSRKAAEQLAARQREGARPSLDNIYLAQHHATRAAQVLRRAAAEQTEEDIRQYIEAWSVQLRRIADKLDDFIAHNSK